MVGRDVKHFVISVYVILLVQLVFTYGVATGMNECTILKTFVMNYAMYLLPIVGVVALIILLTFLICNLKYIVKIALFCVFTLCMALIIGLIHIQLIQDEQNENLLLSVKLTIGVFCTLSLLVWIMPLCHTNMFILEQILIVCLFVLLFWQIYNPPFYQFMFGSIGVSIFVCYIIIDTWRLCCTSHKDVLLSALDLYLDILNLTYFIVGLLQKPEQD